VNLAAHTLNITVKGEVDDIGRSARIAQSGCASTCGSIGGTHSPTTTLLRTGHPIRSDTVTHILGTISRRAGLPHPVSPHKLRHYCGAIVLKISGDLALTRQTLRHRTLHMSLQYARLTEMDVLRKFRRASPMDHLGRR